MPEDRKHERFDVVICGGGPAGLSAALWCADLGLSAVILETAEGPGGQLNSIYAPIRNYPGIIETTGEKLRLTLAKQVEAAGVRTAYGVSISEFDADNLAVSIERGESYRGRAIVIATGVRRRNLGIPGEREFVGRGILESGAKQFREVAGQRVAIVGGGDAAIENAIILSETAESVYVIHRRDVPTARQELLGPAISRRNVRFLAGTELTEIAGDLKVENLVLAGKHATDLAVDSVLIRIGVEPNSDNFAGSVTTDEQGYVVIDAHCRTSRPCVYAIGDVTNSHSPTIASAIGQAATAVKNIALRSF